MKYRRYAEYKDSGDAWIGEIPKHWKCQQLKHLVAVPITDGPHVTPELIDEGIPFLSAEAVKGYTLDFSRKRGFIAPAVHQEFAPKCQPVRNDVLMVKSGNTTGAVAWVDTDEVFSVWSPLAMIRANSEFMSPRYVFYYTNSAPFQTSILLACSYGTQPNIGMGVIEQQPVAVPPLGEQARIAAFLDRETAQIDALIAKQERLIAVLQEKRQALISHAVTKGLNPAAPMKDSGVEWLGEVPAHWEVKRLKSLVTDSAAGPYGSSLTKAMYTQEGYRVYGQQQVIPDDFEVGDYYVSEGQYQQMFQYRVLPGDVLVSVVGTTGRVAVVPDNVAPGIINPRLVRYRPDFSKVRSRYLQAALRSQTSQAQLSQHATGSTMDVLNMEILGSVDLAIPPLPEQDMILDWLRDETERISTTVVATESGVELLRERRSSLISAAVTGKIDVRS